MTILNAINIVILIVFTVILVLSYRRMRRHIKDAEGLGSINERGEIGTSEEGDIIDEI